MFLNVFFRQCGIFALLQYLINQSFSQTLVFYHAPRTYRFRPCRVDSSILRRRRRQYSTTPQVQRQCDRCDGTETSMDCTRDHPHTSPLRRQWAANERL